MFNSLHFAMGCGFQVSLASILNPRHLATSVGGICLSSTSIGMYGWARSVKSTLVDFVWLVAIFHFVIHFVTSFTVFYSIRVAIA